MSPLSLLHPDERTLITDAATSVRCQQPTSQAIVPAAPDDIELVDDRLRGIIQMDCLIGTTVPIGVPVHDCVVERPDLDRHADHAVAHKRVGDRLGTSQGASRLAGVDEPRKRAVAQAAALFNLSWAQMPPNSLALQTV